MPSERMPSERGAPELPPKKRSSRWAPYRALVVTVTLVPLAIACNAAIGGGVIALVGGAGYAVAQCYDRVQVRVRDEMTGRYTCEAEVVLAEGNSQRSLRPCYNAALTSGTYRLTARRPGYLPASTDLKIAEHPGDCPHYTHSIELTLRSENDPSRPTRIKPTERVAAPGVVPNPAAPAAAPPGAAATPVPAPATDPAAVPTRSFELVPVDAGAPRAP